MHDIMTCRRMYPVMTFYRLSIIMLKKYSSFFLKILSIYTLAQIEILFFFFITDTSVVFIETITARYL